MTGIINRLSSNQSLLTVVNAQGGWSSSNITVTIDGQSELFEEVNNPHRQLKCLLTDQQMSGSLILNQIQFSADETNLPLIFIFAIKMPSGGIITTTLTPVGIVGASSVVDTVNLQQSAATVNAPGILSPQWFIFRTSPLVVEGSNAFAVDIEISFAPTEVEEAFYFTTPSLYPQFEFFSNNRAVAEVASRLPAVLIETDLNADVVPDAPMLRLIDVATLSLGEALLLTEEFTYLDNEDGFNDSNNKTKSKLINYDVAVLEYLVWLCKFNGTRPVTRFESSLEFVSDPFILGETEGDAGSVLNSTNTLRLTSYLSLNPPALTKTAQENLLRWQLEYGYYGKNAGTIPALISAVKLMLIDTQYVGISYDYDTEPFVINVTTKWDETYGVTGPELIGQPSALVLDAISFSRPLGVLINHELVA